MWILSYWILPVISAAMWLAMLLTLFIRWFVVGQPQYPSMEPDQDIAYISDVGAFGLKPLFITGSVITTVLLDLSFLAERYLRHTGQLVRNTSTAQKVLSILSIIFAIAGSAGLILLSIFDTYRHDSMHDGFLLLFIAGYLFSAIFICAEYQRLGIHYRSHRILRLSFWLKLTFILVEVALAVAFAATSRTDLWNTAAILEWVIALIFTLYILSFVLDLLPTVRTKHSVRDGTELGMSKSRRDGGGFGISVHGAGPGEYEQDLTHDSRGPAASNYRNGVNGYTNGHGR